MDLNGALFKFFERKSYKLCFSLSIFMTSCRCQCKTPCTNETSQLFALTSFHGINNISYQYLQRPSTATSQRQYGNQPKSDIESSHETGWFKRVG